MIIIYRQGTIIDGRWRRRRDVVCDVKGRNRNMICILFGDTQIESLSSLAISLENNYWKQSSLKTSYLTKYI